MKPNDLQKPRNTFLMKIGIPSQVTLIVDSPTNTHFFPRESTVLIFCVEFWLSHLTHDLSQAEKKITDKMTTIYTQNDNFNHFE